jgi:hypothetical protein
VKRASKAVKLEFTASLLPSLKPTALNKRKDQVFGEGKTHMEIRARGFAISSCKSFADREGDFSARIVTMLQETSRFFILRDFSDKARLIGKLGSSQNESI